MRVVTLAAFVMVLLMALGQSQTLYNYNFDSYSRNIPSYTLGYRANGTTIQFNFTTPGTTLSLGSLILTVESDQATPVNVPCSTVSGCTTEQFCVKRCDITGSSRYRFNVTMANMPADSAASSPATMQYFQMEVGHYITLTGGPANGTAATSIYKHTETFRDRVAKLIYAKANQPMEFSIYPVSSASTDTTDNIRLYKVQTIIDANSVHSISGAPELLDDGVTFTTTYDAASQVLKYTTTSYLPLGYYVLVASIGSDNLNFVRIQFTSDSYVCPFNPDYTDYYANYQPCSGSSSSSTQPGFPCINYDTATGMCITCFGDYTLVNGSCKFNDTCPDREYYSFGQCFPVNDLCDAYDAFTGHCLSCKANNSIISNGKCNLILVTCAARQYRVNNTCFNVSALCGSFDTTTGACLTCLTDYDLANGVCTLKVIVCSITQYLVGRTCIDIPVECLNFNIPTRKCLTCVRGSWPNSLGICEKVLCPDRQVPSTYGLFCITVSPQCANYDKLTGDCLSCGNVDATIVGGECVQYTSPLTGCEERERLGFGECVDSQQNCAQYNLVSGNCVTCVSGYDKDYTGRCTLKDIVCQADSVSIQGICVQKPANCATLDNLGLCIGCNTGYQNIYGQCILSKTCLSNQYISESGVCIDGPAGCSSFNPTSGTCLTCSDGSNAVNGVCCPSGQNAFKGQCIDAVTYLSVRDAAESSEVPICIKYHPTMGFCIQCNQNFTPSATSTQTCV